MKYIKRILCLLVVFVLFIPLVYADTYKEKNLVNIYLFYSDSCIHCASEKELLNEIVLEYDNVRIYKYEVSNNSENKDLMLGVADLMDVSVTGVPFTIIADKPYKGFDRTSSKRIFLGTIDYYSEHGYVDKVGEAFGDIELPSYEVTNNSDFYDYLDNYGNYELSILGFKINTNDLSLSLISLIMGFLDGFNISTLLVLLFFGNVLVLMKDKKKFLPLCLIYLGISALLYLICMLCGISLNFNIVRIILGVIVIFMSLCFFNKRRDNDSKIFESIVSVLILGLLLNMIKISCSMSLSSIFMDILSINNVHIIELITYLFIYLLFFLLDDFLVMFILLMVIQTNKKYSKNNNIFNNGLIILLLIIGVFLIIKPLVLTFGF